jgi:glycine cleavage system regulatory protein
MTNEGDVMTDQPESHVDEDIQVYLTGGLSPEQRRAFEAHVATCPTCAAALADARELETAMTAMFAGTRPGEGFEDRIIQKFRKTGSRAGRPLVHPAVRRVAVGVAAAIALAGTGVTISHWLNASPRPITASNLHQLGLSMPMTTSDDRGSTAEDLMAKLHLLRANPSGQPNENSAKHADMVPELQLSRRSLDTLSRQEKDRSGRSDQLGDTNFGESKGRVAGKKGEAEIDTGRVTNRGMALGVDKDGAAVKYELAFKPETDLKLRVLTDEAEKLKEVSDAERKKPALAQEAPHAGAVQNQSFQNANNLGTASNTHDVQDLVKQIPDFTDAPTFSLQGAADPTTRSASARKVIRNGTMQFEVDRFDDALMRVTKLVMEQGGYVATTDSDKLPNGKMKGTLTLRVPPEHLDSLVLMLRGIGDLKSQKIGAEDVSKHYTDLESQLRAAKAMQDRLLEIIKTGKGQIKDLLEAEKQLGVWREKIEQIEGEKRYIDNAVALSTIAVELIERDIRTPATASEIEQVSMSLETDKVDEAYEKARSAIESAKGRILQSELKQFDAGQFGATIQATVPPDAAEQLIARLRQLDARISHFERQNKRTTKAGEGPITGATPLHREDAVISMQIYNLANIAPRRTTSVVLAVQGVDAAYQKALDQIRAAGGRIVTSSLSRPDAQQQSADLDFQIPTDKSPTVEDALRSLGDVMRNEATENPDTANVTEGKRGFHLRIVSTAAVPPRETQDAQLAAADVPSAFNQILVAVNSAGGRVLQSDLKEQDPHDKTANLSFEIPRSALASLNTAVDKAAQILTRNVSRSQDTENTLDSKLRLTYSLVSAGRLAPRQTVTIREEVTDVEKAADDLTNAAVSAGGRRLSSGDISQDPAGHVTAQVVVEVPMDKAPAILDQLERTGHRRGKQVGYDSRVPDGPLTRARIDVTFSNSAASLGGEESTWDAIRRGLETSALGLRWSLQMLVIGLCFVAPWVLVVWAVWKFARRRKTTMPAPAV